MKLSVFAVLLQDKSFDEACAYLASKGVQAVEIGCGGFPGDAHCKPLELLNDETKLQAFKDTLARHHLDIAALSVHGNAVHPDKAVAEKAHTEFENAVLLAEKLGVETVVTFSGCPGGCPEDKTPNWVTCPWPDDYTHILEYQWNEVLIPYWKKESEFCRAHNVRVAFEMHPGFCVYNPETMMRIRKACGDNIGANFDPSHLFWQGIDPVAAIRYLGDAIFYFHAKDTKIDEINTGINGVLDTKPYSDEIHRSWIFRSVGYGHAHQTWKDMMSALRMVGYDGPISIEHEDSLMTPSEGLNKAIAMLKDVMMFEAKGPMWWA
ncbi:MAG: sugar phosphate isomerase/epimerase [Eubacteriales bacterium]|nr:sugar phosphate isomerase/epimerase [Clostridiales bacterium]MDD6933497.1 sugar phosphate isomerase/epimerase [Eubacteriales bacterium]MDO4387521.1 sugar phosphate isomerase/epimerase [Eubacteriales bacterium]MDY2601962.1 sugar phosphate isomerase/epimerase [Eubacteriales bacterium]